MFQIYVARRPLPLLLALPPGIRTDYIPDPNRIFDFLEIKENVAAHRYIEHFLAFYFS